jgi:hypothetical protein
VDSRCAISSVIWVRSADTRRTVSVTCCSHLAGPGQQQRQRRQPALG